MTTQANLVSSEQDVRRFWHRYEVPAAARIARRGGPSYLILQEPLAVAGQPEADQIRLLVTSDLFARFQAMRGHDVQCLRGWSCHGLGVEVVVEQSARPEGAGVDLVDFNAACRQQALLGLQAGETLAERLAVWLDPAATFVTLTPYAIGTTWAALKRLWEMGRLRRERRIAPVCPRCATPLSWAEADQHQVDTEGRSVWIQLPWDGEENAYFLTWSPAPWTLTGQVALAANPDASYALVELGGHDEEPPVRLLLAEEALTRTLPGAYRLVRKLKGKALRSARYRPPFTFLPADAGMGRVVLSKEVPLGYGTGLKPVTPTFDASSLALAEMHELTLPELLDDRGRLDAIVTPWRGLTPLEAEPLLVEALRTWGLLYREQATQQRRALCPYCNTPILSLARPVWLVPTHGNPWIVGRERAWGTPLPIWECTACGHETCVAGLDDLAHRVGTTPEQIDPHRPAVDRLTFPCRVCGGKMARTGAVLDPAFESAALPLFCASLPGPAAVAVALDEGQPGWLAALDTAATLLRETAAYDHAVALSTTQRASPDGPDRGPSSSALRWAAYVGTTPEEAERCFLQPLWKTVLDMTAVRQELSAPAPGGDEATLDRWLMGRLYETLLSVTDDLQAGAMERAARSLAAFSGDLTTWYAVHRPGGNPQAVSILSRLLAPFVPHLAEAIHRHFDAGSLESVHVEGWPMADSAWAAPDLVADMAQVRRLVDLGREARRQTGIEPVRLLRLALVGALSAKAIDLPNGTLLRDLLTRLLGVVEVQFTTEATTHVGWQVNLIPEQAATRSSSNDEIAAALESLAPAEAAQLAAQLRSGRSAHLEVGGQAITLLPDEVVLSARASPGWASAADPDFLVVLDIG